MALSNLQDTLKRDYNGATERAKRTLHVPSGLSDALYLSGLADLARQDQSMTVLICADAQDAFRLKDELSYFDPSLRIEYFPDWETLPYDQMSPHQDLVSERLLILYRLQQTKDIDVLLVTPSTASQSIAPTEFLNGRIFYFEQGEVIDRDALRARLVAAGYEHVSQVVAPGEFCIRGSLVDIFPTGQSSPFRLDFWDDELDSIRHFDPDTQRSLQAVQSIRILPGREFPTDEAGIAAFRSHWREQFDGNPSQHLMYKDIGNGLIDAGIEYYLPLFFSQRACLLDYLPNNAKLVLIGNVQAELSRFYKDTQSRYEFLKADNTRPVLPPDQLYLTDELFFTRLKAFIRFQIAPVSPLPLANVAIDRKADDPCQRLKDFLDEARIKKQRVMLCAASIGRRETMAQLFARHALTLNYCDSFADFLAGAEPVMLSVSPLYQGFWTDRVCVLTETELYQRSPNRSRHRRQANNNVEAMIRDLSELNVGDPVVHQSHGIGRYAGLEIIQTASGEEEFLRLEYAKEAKLFVPVSQLQLISRYTGSDAEHAPMHTLGKGDWDKAKKKAAEKARDTAAELLNLYALREKSVGHAFEFSKVDYEAFADSFPFEETPDQQAAIDAVLNDMRSEKPMDRLVCGDVGFGKTEVALRAAFAAVMGGKQVCILCPTTLLAEQHAQNFADRFANWPVKVAELSRFRTGKQTAATLDGLATGTIDIVVGTHKVLSQKVQFNRLGLIIIDEEHRFGVRQKEELKKLRAQVDVLTLTATPIPRTLAMSLEGIRDFSVIATAPEKRLAIKTMVRPYSNELVREAVLRELKRGGQVYFLHNDVATIENKREQLAALVPQARIVVGHGQMSERELEAVMRDFYQQRFNVLLCTTIIETGIDVPTANTIIINRADKLGLAQLHQLRGRVGRSHHQAYAYMLTPGKEAMTPNAVKRLEAIQNLEGLGSGFYLSMHDLEIRGAGEVLGDQQSGEIESVGFDMYNQMLRQAVKSMRSGEPVDLDAPFVAMTEINLHASALLPKDYVSDVHQRLNFYKQLAGCETLAQIEDIREMLGDRYGKLPTPANTLIETHRLRLYCEHLGIERIEATEAVIIVTFASKPHFEPMHLIELMQKSRDMRMSGPTKLKIERSTPTIESRLAYLRGFVKQLDGQARSPSFAK